MTSSATRTSQNEAAGGPIAGRSPLAQLLHALNQPLTGLQCSMEVALATPRTPDQYVRGLREGLELTERMRALVEAIREVTDLEEEQKQTKDEKRETTELKTVLQETLDDLAPVAEVKNVRVAFNCSATSPLAVRAERRRMAGTVFRFLESALSLAARGTVLLIETGEAETAGAETGGAPGRAWFRVRWHMGRPASSFTGPELGLIVAQAGLEHTGAVWERERAETLETVTVRLPSATENGRHS